MGQIYSSQVLAWDVFVYIIPAVDWVSGNHYSDFSTFAIPVPQGFRSISTPVTGVIRRTGNRVDIGSIEKAIQAGAEATLAVEAEKLRAAVEEAFTRQIVDTRQVSAEERKMVKSIGWDIDALVDAYRGNLEVLAVRNGFKVGFDEVESFIHAGRVFSMLDLAKLFELGSAQVMPRPHWGPVWRTFKARAPKVADKMRDSIWAQLVGPVEPAVDTPVVVPA